MLPPHCSYFVVRARKFEGLAASVKRGLWSVAAGHQAKLDAAWAKNADGKHPVFFVFTVRSNQYDDPEGDARRILSGDYDDHPKQD